MSAYSVLLVCFIFPGSQLMERCQCQTHSDNLPHPYSYDNTCIMNNKKTETYIGVQLEDQKKAEQSSH